MFLACPVIFRRNGDRNGAGRLGLVLQLDSARSGRMPAVAAVRVPTQRKGQGELGPSTSPGRPRRAGIARQPIICLPRLSRRRLNRGGGQRHRSQAARFRAASSPNAWRSRALIRDCHPGPASRSFATTSGSSRTLICSSGVRLRPPAAPPDEGVAVELLGLVAQFRRQFRSVSGSVQSAEPACLFVAMGISHGYDATRIAARCPDQHDTPPGKVSAADKRSSP